ncbi:unnamed protein product [Caenorhabditis angaria]|uniref:N-acetylgalactosaminide beta-1,3-galactosyltransferase n=1 Tax=Caenorhabditis angaria TaxID=860376 RepID=A0A9P1IXE2_9PELO|nr:unnamed protein product [Caenorhabditis angaria]
MKNKKRIMVQCMTFLCKVNENYNIYNEEWDQQKISKKRKNLCCILAAILFGTLALIIILNCLFSPKTPKASYDRKNDFTLMDKIYISDAAQKLPKKGKLFCWVQTSKIYHDTRSLAINETWIHRCDHGQLFTSEKFNDSRIPYSTVFAGIPDDYYNLFFKSRFAFHYIHNHISADFDWYLKADDDTFVIVENLQKYLAHLNPDEPHYLGYVLKPYLKNGYNAGGAGYVLSRAALKLFAEHLYYNESACPDDIYEDVGIARCLASAGIYPEDTRNSKGQNRFNTFSPSNTFHQLKANIEWVKYKENMGYDAFANDLISFHHLTPDEIRLFDILLYRTKIA